MSLVGKDELKSGGKEAPAKEERATPSQHLFQQLVVAITNGMISAGHNVSRITPATAGDIATAAKNLQVAIEEIGGVRR